MAQAVREAAARLCRSGPVDAEPADDLVGSLGPAGAVELVALVGRHRLLPQLMAVFGVGAPGGAAADEG